MNYYGTLKKNIIEEIELIKRKALEVHRKYSYETDFIIMYVNNDEINIFIIR